MKTYEIITDWMSSIDVLFSQGAYVWNNYIGTFFAFISLIMVFTTDYRLVRRFLSSGRRFKNWLRLFCYTAGRVLFTVWIYYGLGWLYDGAAFLLGYLWAGVQAVFFFITGTFTRKGLVQFTTAAIVIIFLIVTVAALLEKFVPSVRRFNDRFNARMTERDLQREKKRNRILRKRGKPQVGNSEPQYIPQICEIEPKDDLE